MNVTLRGRTKAVVETMVKEGYANSQSEAIRLAIMDFSQHHLSEEEIVNKKLDKIDSEIAIGKRKLLNSSEALGEYSKYLEWLDIYTDKYDEGWTEYFDKLDSESKIRVVKKIKKILEFPKKRHLGGKAKFFVDEVGQNRILYRLFEETNEVRFYFVGNHKEYEKWYKQFF